MADPIENKTYCCDVPSAEEPTPPEPDDFGDAFDFDIAMTSLDPRVIVEVMAGVGLPRNVWVVGVAKALAASNARADEAETDAAEQRVAAVKEFVSRGNERDSRLDRLAYILCDEDGEHRPPDTINWDSVETLLAPFGRKKNPDPPEPDDEYLLPPIPDSIEEALVEANARADEAEAKLRRLAELRLSNEGESCRCEPG